jgi:Domain of unknown function (DUF5615)
VKLRFLIDENLSPRLTTTLHRHYPMIDAVRVGDGGAPPIGTLDPDVLRYLETEQRALITDNRASMPVHLADHTAGGGRHWGIFEVRKDAPLGALAELIALYWEASEAEEWIDRVEWLDI